VTVLSVILGLTPIAILALFWVFMGEALSACSNGTHTERRSLIERRIGRGSPPPLVERRKRRI
jgi:hypothetical protein